MKTSAGPRKTIRMKRNKVLSISCCGHESDRK